MKLLNLDDVAPSNRFVSIRGVEYQVINQSLRFLLASVKREAALANANDAEAAFEHMIESAQAMIPDCPREVLLDLTNRQLNALVQFASQGDEPDAEKPEGEQAEGK